MLDILNKFNLKIQMVDDADGKFNRLNLKTDGYTKTVDFDVKKLHTLTSEKILELFNLYIVIKPDDRIHSPPYDTDPEYLKRSKINLETETEVIGHYYLQIIVIPNNPRIVNNTPPADPERTIKLTYS
jgi:hypothetical protein